MRRTRNGSGFTLIELMLSIAVLAVLLALAIPAFTGQFQKQRHKGAAERLVSEIQFARSEAVGANDRVFVNVQGGAAWCIGVSDLEDCDCSSDGDCTVDGQERTTKASDFGGVTMDAVNDSIEFENVRGMPEGDPPDFFFDGENDKRIGVRVNQLGRVSICSPAGEQKVGEYADC